MSLGPAHFPGRLPFNPLIRPQRAPASMLLVASGDFHLERQNVARGGLLLSLEGNDLG